MYKILSQGARHWTLLEGLGITPTVSQNLEGKTVIYINNLYLHLLMSWIQLVSFTKCEQIKSVRKLLADGNLLEFQLSSIF